MATKKSSRTNIKASEVVPKFTKQVSDDLELDVGMAMWALQDMVLNYPKIKLTHLTSETCINVLADKIYMGLAKAGRSISTGHPAFVEIDRLRVAVTCMEELMRDTDEHDMSMSKEAIGRCLYAFFCDAAYALDNAQKALGDTTGIGLIIHSTDYCESRAKGGVAHG
jgi:hypothetical protein